MGGAIVVACALCRWVLRFELTVGPPFPVLGLNDGAAAPRPRTLEALSWHLPLLVHGPLGA